MKFGTKEEGRKKWCMVFKHEMRHWSGERSVGFASFLLLNGWVSFFKNQNIPNKVGVGNFKIMGGEG